MYTPVLEDLETLYTKIATVQPQDDQTIEARKAAHKLLKGTKLMSSADQQDKQNNVFYEIKNKHPELTLFPTNLTNQLLKHYGAYIAPLKAIIEAQGRQLVIFWAPDAEIDFNLEVKIEKESDTSKHLIKRMKRPTEYQDYDVLIINDLSLLTDKTTGAHLPSRGFFKVMHEIYHRLWPIVKQSSIEQSHLQEFYQWLTQLKHQIQINQRPKAYHRILPEIDSALDTLSSVVGEGRGEAPPLPQSGRGGRGVRVKKTRSTSG